MPLNQEPLSPGSCPSPSPGACSRGAAAFPLPQPPENRTPLPPSTLVFLKQVTGKSVLSTKRNYNKSVAPTLSPLPAGDGSLRRVPGRPGPSAEQPPAEGRGRCIYRTAVTCGDRGGGDGAASAGVGQLPFGGVQQRHAGSVCPPLSPCPRGRKRFGYCERGGGRSVQSEATGAAPSSWGGPMQGQGRGGQARPRGGGGKVSTVPYIFRAAGWGDAA